MSPPWEEVVPQYYTGDEAPGVGESQHAGGNVHSAQNTPEYYIINEFFSHLTTPPGGEKAKHHRSEYFCLSIMASKLATPAPREWPVITRL